MGNDLFTILKAYTCLFLASGARGLFHVYALRIAKFPLLCWGHAPTCDFSHYKKCFILQSARLQQI